VNYDICGSKNLFNYSGRERASTELSRTKCVCARREFSKLFGPNPDVPKNPKYIKFKPTNQKKRKSSKDTYIEEKALPKLSNSDQPIIFKRKDLKQPGATFITHSKISIDDP